MKKGFITQAEADEFSEKLFEQLDTRKIPGFLPSLLGGKMRAKQVNVNPYASMTEIAKEKKSSIPDYLIQIWMRSNTTLEYLRMWGEIYNPRFQEAACDELIHTVKATGTTLTPSLWINTTQAMAMRTSRGKGGGTTAHPEIAVMFRAWLFPKVMLDLVRCYRMVQHDNMNISEYKIKLGDFSLKLGFIA